MSALENRSRALTGYALLTIIQLYIWRSVLLVGENRLSDENNYSFFESTNLVGFHYIHLSSAAIWNYFICVFATHCDYSDVGLHIEQELLTLPEHLSSPRFFSGDHATPSLVFFVVFSRSLFVPLFFFLLAIALSVFRRFTS